MRAFWRWLVAAIVLWLGRGRPEPRGPEARPSLPSDVASRRAEMLAATLLLVAALGSTGFVVLYFVEPNTQLLGLSLGLGLAAIAAALILAGKVLVPQEKAVEPRKALVHPEEQAEVAQLVEEADKGVTRRRLLFGAAGTAGTALVAALVVPAASLGPVLGTGALYDTPWRAGRRLVGEDGRPIPAEEVTEGGVRTAFAEGAEQSHLGSSLILIRLPAGQLRLPGSRAGWAPEGILAFSKICTHAGCAVSMFRYPLYAPHAPGPALVCPCHYSTFDPTTGGDVLFGPAGRPLPQLPLQIDAEGNLRAAGNFSGPVGPSWWGVRMRGAS